MQRCSFYIVSALKMLICSFGEGLRDNALLMQTPADRQWVHCSASPPLGFTEHGHMALRIVYVNICKSKHYTNILKTNIFMSICLYIYTHTHICFPYLYCRTPFLFSRQPY